MILVEHIETMKPGAVLCNSGHFDVEIDVAGLRERAVASRAVRTHATEYTLPGGTTVVLLADPGGSWARARPRRARLR